MAIFFEYIVIEILVLIVAFIVGFYVYMKNVVYDYWRSRKVSFPEPVVPFGNLWPVLSIKISLGEFIRDTYLAFKTSPVVGIYTFHRPTLVINDPDLIRFVLTKEFPYFHNRGLYINEKVDPVLGNIFLLPGNRWKFMRTKFSPTFTSSKIKQMFFSVKESSEMLTMHLLETAKNSELVEIKELMARYSTDVIASTAFGIQCNSIENPDAEFRKWGKKVFMAKPLRNAFCILFPQLVKLFHARVIDEDVSNFFISAFKKTVDYRVANDVVRRDFLDLVMQLMNKGYLQDDDGTRITNSSDDNTDRITMLEGAAQAFVFWLAGFETSSTTASYCLYELALHLEIQDKLSDEINTVLKKFGGLTYEGVKEMHYLHKVVCETLRKYPPLPFLNRECTEDIVLPDIDLRVSKGTPILIPVLGLHSDPDIYPDPEKFDPERFSEENVNGRHQYSYLAFGEGPRNCIGKRFGFVQTKVGLISLLSKYRFTPGPNLKVPIELAKGNFVLHSKGGIELRVDLRQRS